MFSQLPMQKRMCVASGLVFLMLLVAMVLPCEARLVEIDWGVPTQVEGTDATADPVSAALAALSPAAAGEAQAYATSREEALQRALAIATTEEAFEILQTLGNVNPVQRTALQSYIRAKAQLFIRGYRELYMATLPSGLNRLSVEVDVDRQWLADSLKKLGAFYLVRQSLSCSAFIEGDAKTASRVALLSSAAGMQMKSAVVPLKQGSAEAEADAINAQQGLHFILRPAGAIPDKGDITMWSASLVYTELGLDAPVYSAKTQGPTVDAVWETLWPAYLATRFALPEQKGQLATLRVWGWQGAEGASLFDKALRQWESGAKDIALLEIVLLSSDTKAHWQVNVVDFAKLDAQIRSYTEQRGLSYELVPLQKQDMGMGSVSRTDEVGIPETEADQAHQSGQTSQSEQSQSE